MVETDERDRPYRSELRQQQAAQTRRAGGRGGGRRSSAGRATGATTFTQLAEEAGVSVETVRKHGPKSALLQAALELASFGVEGETDFFATDIGRAMLAGPRTADELAALVGRRDGRDQRPLGRPLDDRRRPPPTATRS